ncbi:MAG: ubiquinone biosynthesis regulatory protein kinase UbiB [Gammaproteobacteria bacterium RBG_16_51_14]|nr:MAG: ubiquinone biosynthesis regulatory protein kinase UbiB [Gammaproteobacteria bacterium RBG_16_51_14]
MFSPGQIFRILTIQRVLIRHGLDEIIFATHLFRPIRFVFYLLPWNWFRRVHEPRAERLRRVLEELGPIFVKFGQILSTRRDLLPADIAEEFARLQDRVPPFPGRVARSIIEKAYEKTLDEVFLEFDETPLASASVAQVHAARLKDGRDFIVKVIRPGIETTIRRDLELMYFLAKKADIYYSKGRHLRVSSVVKEFERTLLAELDLMREAASASQLRRNFINEKQYYVPEVNWDLTRRNVLVMERISGIPVWDINGLKKAGIDLKWLAEYGVEIFFTQVFRDSFFHADMHPGNIFVEWSDTDQLPRVNVVDFGIMSSLNEFDQRYLAENFLAFLNRDYQRVAKLHIESGWVPTGTRMDEFESAIRTVCEPLLDRPMKEISCGDILLRLFQTARSFNMEIMPQLVLLQKTIVNIEGIGRQLYPDLDLWKTARPQLERWMNDRVGVRGVIKGVMENIPLWLDRLPGLPGKAIDVIEHLHDGKIQLENKSRDIEKLRHEMRIYNKRTVRAVIGSGFLLSAAIIFGLDNYVPAMFAGAPVVAWVAGIIGITLLILSTGE